LIETTTPEPQQARQQGLQHVSIPLAKAIEELWKRAAQEQAEEDAKEAL